MPKKIIDISPPTAFYDDKLIPEKKKWLGNNIRKVVGGIFLFLVLIFIVLHFFLADAEIKIWPETEVFNADEKIIIAGEADRLDLKAKIIPGEIFESEKTISEEFPASGSFLKKAEGIIRLYNNFTTQSETWRKNTRFVSSEGKLFLSKDRINVPGAILKNGKITPSFVDVKVIAAEAGSEYNIAPSHFSIAAFLGTARYTKYYGESFEPMVGGGEFPQVTKEDLEKAESILIERAKIESENDFKNKIPAGFVFLAQVAKIDILEKSSSVEVGAEAEKFKFQVVAKLTTPFFKSKDLEDFAASFILSQVSPEKIFHRQSLKINYQPETFNPELGRSVISLNISAKIYPVFNLDSLKKGLAGKSLTEARFLLQDQPEIIRSEIRVFPFWMKGIPNKLDKIKTELRIE